jgi:predicted trehalose synthase
VKRITVKVSAAMAAETNIVIANARRAADLLAVAGNNKAAEDVRRLCRNASALRQTCQRLHGDNMALWREAADV